MVSGSEGRTIVEGRAPLQTPGLMEGVTRCSTMVGKTGRILKAFSEAVEKIHVPDEGMGDPNVPGSQL